MGLYRGFVTFVFVAAIVPMTVLATEHIVGDEAGWTLGFDYQAWAKTKDFRVGDSLVFKYQAGIHNVFKVNGTSFQNCTVPPPNEALTTGNDTIILATPGRKWYLCGVGKHCINGQKLAITVQLVAEPPSLPPYPYPFVAHSHASKYQATSYTSMAAQKGTVHKVLSLVTAAIAMTFMLV